MNLQSLTKIYQSKNLKKKKFCGVLTINISVMKTSALSSANNKRLQSLRLLLLTIKPVAQSTRCSLTASIQQKTLVGYFKNIFFFDVIYINYD